MDGLQTLTQREGLSPRNILISSSSPTDNSKERFSWNWDEQKPWKGKKKLSVHDFSILVAAVPPTPMNWLLYKNWTRTGVCSKNKHSWLQRPASRPGGPAAETNGLPFNMITLLKYTKVKNWTRTGVCSHFFSFFQFCFCLELLDLEGGQKMQVWVLFCVFSSLNRKLLKVGNWILLRYTEHFVKFKKVELVKSRFFCH